eukprot:TRINITY_DN3087_c0_g1_i2.p1 TRINITY_DN3087_c0_g1~~TRINITY_DN3087_c0_g1_i2.p1  ORF type:complete len:880 (+),score=164.93 TRINITY_DN3087_c0_g1_i2:39-2642(+)
MTAASGDRVEQNPLTVFFMFALTVVLTVIVEVGKHWVEHHTADPHRKAALGAIYAELMLVGIVSFLLILAAEVGLTDLEIPKPGCSPPDSSSSGSAAGSSSPGGSAGSAAGSSAAQLLAGSLGGASGSGSGAGTPPTASPTAAPAAGPPGPFTASPDCCSSCPATVCPSGSGSGSDPCMLGFDILMFEYAHLVLFFMGLTYCTFIQIAFVQRDRYCKEIKELQEHLTLAGWLDDGKPFRSPSVRSTMGMRGCCFGGRDRQWARSVLLMRGAIAIYHREMLEVLCVPEESQLEITLAKIQGRPAPGRRAPPSEVQVRFDMARFAHRAYSEVLVDMLHVPPAVWCAVLGMCATSLLSNVGMNITQTTLVSATLGPVLSSVLVWKLSQHFCRVARGAAGHPDLAKVEFHQASGPVKDELAFTEDAGKRGKEWAEGGGHPWADLEGCIPDDSAFNQFDLMDPGALVLQIQVVVFALCFYIGVMVMLTSTLLNRSDYGPVLVFALWIIPVGPLFWLVPRAILVYALTHRTEKIDSGWLIYAVREPEPADHGHGHGHGGHGHGDETEDPEAAAEKKRCAIDELVEFLSVQCASPVSSRDPPASPDGAPPAAEARRSSAALPDSAALAMAQAAKAVMQERQQRRIAEDAKERLERRLLKLESDHRLQLEQLENELHRTKRLPAPSQEVVRADRHSEGRRSPGSHRPRFEESLVELPYSSFSADGAELSPGVANSSRLSLATAGLESTANRSPSGAGFRRHRTNRSSLRSPLAPLTAGSPEEQEDAGRLASSSFARDGARGRGRRSPTHGTLAVPRTHSTASALAPGQAGPSQSGSWGSSGRRGGRGQARSQSHIHGSHAVPQRHRSTTHGQGAI